MSLSTENSGLQKAWGVSTMPTSSPSSSSGTVFRKNSGSAICKHTLPSLLLCKDSVSYQNVKAAKQRYVTCKFTLTRTSVNTHWHHCSCVMIISPLLKAAQHCYVTCKVNLINIDVVTRRCQVTWSASKTARTSFPGMGTFSL